MLGAMHAESFKTDPKHLGFVLARYHFVARMLQGKERVLEVGCGDGTGAHIVRKAVGLLHGIDTEEYGAFPGTFLKRDIRHYETGFKFDGVYALDVLEHLDVADELRAVGNMCSAMRRHGVCIVGVPSKESQPYASEMSRRHHVNCKTEEGLRETMSVHFHNVFLFGMNDSTLHTGFGPFCQYRLAVCAGKR